MQSHDFLQRRITPSAGSYGHSAAPSLIKRLAMWLGAAVAIWMVVQVAYLLPTSRKAPTEAGVAASFGKSSLFRSTTRPMVFDRQRHGG
jgi:hypothetical protein